MRDEEDFFECEKFDGCDLCKHRFTLRICRQCDVGEEFEEVDMDEVDKYFDGRI